MLIVQSLRVEIVSVVMHAVFCHEYYQEKETRPPTSQSQARSTRSFAEFP